MHFEAAHAAWVRYHLDSRTGERRGRLERGHQHAETLFVRNVWWPLRRNFDDLHPEYEVPDWRGRSYFADLAWLPGFVKVLIEIKGFGAHVRDMDRHKYCSELNRETFLHAMGYNVISFAYDDVEQRPDACISLLRMVFSRYQCVGTPLVRAVLAEKEVLRLALGCARPLRPKDVAEHCRVDPKTAVLMLRKLCAKGWLLPSYRGKGMRVVAYEPVHGAVEFLN